MTMFSVNTHEPTQEALHKAIVKLCGHLAATELLAGHVSQFHQLSIQLAQSAGKDQRQVLLRIHLAFWCAHQLNFLMTAAWAPKAVPQLQDRDGMTVSGVSPNLFNSGDTVSRLRRDDSRIARIYLGKEPKRFWALSFLGHCLAHAYEDIFQDRKAGTINNLARGTRGPDRSFLGFLVAVLKIIQADQKILAECGTELEILSPQSFAPAMRSFKTYPRDIWAIPIAIASEPAPKRRA